MLTVRGLQIHHFFGGVQRSHAILIRLKTLSVEIHYIFFKKKKKKKKKKMK